MRYSDYKKISFTATSTTYLIGTESGKLFASESMVLKTTKTCLVKINNDILWIPYYSDVLYSLDRQIVRIQVKRDSEDGDLEIWSEGKLAV